MVAAVGHHGVTNEMSEMAVKSCDDPMDLGPFLQNYVLKNPFGQPFFSTTTENNSSSNSQSQTQTTAASGNSRSSPISRPRTKPRLPVPATSNSRTTKAHTVRERLARLRGEQPSGSAASTTDDGSGLVEGCSTTFESAISRLKKRISEKTGDEGTDVLDVEHLAILSWLHQNYRCLPSRHFVATHQLLLRVQQVIPDVTSEMLDDAIKAMFPSCLRPCKRNGLSFYQGLIARPELDVLENPTFANALTEIRQGALTTGQASAKYGIRESALIGAVVWLDDDDGTVSAKTLTSNGVVLSASSDGADATSVDDSSQLGNNTSVVRSATQQHKPSPRKRRLINRNTNDNVATVDCSPIERRPRCKSESSADEADSDNVDFEMMLQDVPGLSMPSSRRNCTPPLQNASAKAAPFNSRLPNSFDEVEIKVEQFDDRHPGDLDTEKISNLSRQPLNFSQEKQQHSSSSERNNTESHSSSHQPTDLSLTTKRTDNGGAVQGCSVSPPVSSRHDDSSVRRLREDLSAARETNLALQEELSTRDFHLAQLAEDFFRLHEQFRQLAHQFQLVLGDIQPQSANGVVRNNRH